MGVQQLRIKKLQNYRNGYASRYCGICDNFTTVQITGPKGKDLGKQPRCKFFGLDADRRYRINPQYICDAYDGSKGLKRLKGDSFPAAIIRPPTQVC